MRKVMEFTVTIFFKVLFFFQGKPDTTPALSKAVELYSDNTFAKLFTQIRVWDAPLREVDKLTSPKGLILDLGCGDGFLSNYLAISKPTRKVIGIEINKERIKYARKGIKNVQFMKGDVLKQKLPPGSSILLIDVLHHLSSFSAQEKLLKYCYSRLDKGGQLIVSEIVKKPVVKYLFAWVTDATIFPILFEKKLFTTSFFYRDTMEWQNLLKGLGFRVKIKEAHFGKPFSHTIFECRKI